MPAIRDLAPIEIGNRATGPAQALRLSDAGGLTQFGAFVHILPPGSATALKHWHGAEDELVYVLSGEVTLIEGDGAERLSAGDCATFKAGVALGHCLRNDGGQEARLLVLGTRAGADTVTYPDHDVILTYDDATGREEFRDSAGNPTISAYRKPAPAPRLP